MNKTEHFVHLCFLLHKISIDAQAHKEYLLNFLRKITEKIN